MSDRQAFEIEGMKRTILEPAQVHHLMVQANRRGALPASKLPKLIEEWDEPQFAEFQPRTAWSSFNAFTAVEKTRQPWDRIEGTLRLSAVFREALVPQLDMSATPKVNGQRRTNQDPRGNTSHHAKSQDKRASVHSQRQHT